MTQSREQILEAALYKIIHRCNHIRQLPVTDKYRDGLRDAWAEARSIALEALNANHPKFPSVKRP